MLRNVVLLGAGHAHLMVLREFRRNPPEDFHLSLVTPEAGKVYSGMLPGLIAGHYRLDQTAIDLERLTRGMGAEYLQTTAVGLDCNGRRVLCRDQPPIPYDLLSIDTGSVPAGTDLPGVAEHAVLLKPPGRLERRVADLSRDVHQARGVARIGVVGGGAAGVEIALALDHRLRQDLAVAGLEGAGLSFAIVTAGRTLMPDQAPSTRRLLGRILGRRNIVIIANARVVAIETEPAKRLVIADGRAVEVDHVVWATEAAAPPWLRDAGLALDERGFVAVEPTLRSVSDGAVFAAGDVASVRGESDAAKSGVQAVRQGRVLAQNLRRALTGRPLVPYRSHRRALALVSTGERRAVGARNGLSVEGAWVWRWKDRIDRAFVDSFKKLSETTDIN